MNISAVRQERFDHIGVPEREATITGVSPSSSAAFGFAPAANNLRTIASLPFWQAVQSGVAPRSFAAFTLAPARISRSALSTSSR